MREVQISVIDEGGDIVRTFEIITKPGKSRSMSMLSEYFRNATMDAKCMYNIANFYIRNTMSGIRKSPEERTHSETEVLHDVFTCICRHNEEVWNRALSDTSASGLVLEARMHRAFRTYLEYPTEKAWMLSYYALDVIFKMTKNPVYVRMSAQTNQRAIRKATDAWMSYFKARKAYRKCPALFTGRPRIPGYLKTQMSLVSFSNQTSRISQRGDRLYLGFPKTKAELCLGLPDIYKGLKHVKTDVLPAHGVFRVLITFDDGTVCPKAPENPKRILGIDVGLGNFLAVANNYGDAVFVIRGGALKAANRAFNKKHAKLLSAISSGKDSKHSEKHSRHLDVISRKRRCFIRDFFYKCAWYVCHYAKSSGAEVIVIGHNKGQKQNISIGKVNNQAFVSIPYEKFIGILTCVAAKCGIPVIAREESYTSKASLLDMDKIPTFGDEGSKSCAFSGKRIKRGLYKSKYGTLINADINGAGNIIRKEYPDAFKECKDLSFLYKTTNIVSYRSMYKKGKPREEVPVRFKFHNKGLGRKLAVRDRRATRLEYLRLSASGGLICAADVCSKKAA